VGWKQHLNARFTGSVLTSHKLWTSWSDAKLPEQETNATPAHRAVTPKIRFLPDYSRGFHARRLG
jgi:hypothetical protein